ncbi:hypothetical protein LCGC14_1147940 [marine sediment metagenome]|uniref:Uncharacterized protein n=1 Tax=marine sediment metagenome TaxID=412755 RepID=A0A0F9MJM5_9ZZZZ
MAELGKKVKIRRVREPVPMIPIIPSRPKEPVREPVPVRVR